MNDSSPSSASLRHVLVVDDEPLVAAYLKAALQLHGFTVWSAATGADALRLLGENSQFIGLALIDLSLPDVGCADLLTGLRRLSPELRCCVMGATAAENEDALRAAGAVNVVMKPLSLADLTYALWGLQRPAST